MSISTADAPLLRHTSDALARPLPDAIRDARADLPAIVAVAEARDTIADARRAAEA